MKVKVRGLVFVGFAAAVFATSAMADAASDAADKKTVTSKFYVDQTFQTKNLVATAPAANSDDWSSQTKYPSMAVLSGAISDAEITIQGDTDYTTASEDDGTWTVGIDTTKLGTTADIYGNTNTTRLTTVGAVHGLLDDTISGTETNNMVPTSLAVQTYAEATANKLAEATDALGTTTITQANATGTDGNKTFPTTRNVYDFVTDAISTAGDNYQPAVDATTDGTNKLKVGYLSSGANSTAEWKTLQADDTANVTHYVSIAQKANDATTYNVNLDSNTITSATSDFVASNDTNQATKRPKLATAGAVYDFVSTGYQPVAPAGVKVGNNGGWDTLAVDTTYLGLDTTTTTGTVQVTVNTATASADISGASASNSTGANNLTTAYAVNAYVQGLLHGNEIPAMPEACTTAAASGHYCALVYGNRAAVGQTADYGLEWTVMAPTGN